MQTPINISSDEIEDRINKWRFNPLLFAKDVFDYTPDAQQKQLFVEVEKLFRAKCKVRLNKPLSAEEAIYSKKRGISIMSGKGTGKTTGIAILCFWFLMLNHDAKFPITGPSYDQVKDTLYAEMYKWYYRCKLQDWVEMQSDMVYRKYNGEVKENWFLKIRTAAKSASKEQQGNTLAGWHEDFMMMVVDEAADTPDPVFSKFDTTLTKPVNFVIMGFNPTRVTGFAYDTHFNDEADQWIKLQWSALKSDHVTKQQVEDLKRKYGEGSSEYRISVLGLPPVSEKDSLIPMEWINAAVDRYKETDEEDDAVIAGIDIAREGVDKTSVVLKKRSRIFKIFRYNEPDAIKNADRIIEILGEYRVKAAAIDAIGVGGPVFDYIKRFYKDIRAVDFHKLATQAENFGLCRDELWWAIREDFQNGLIDIPNDRELINEFSSIKYGTDSKGRIKVESKKAIKSRGCPSPDSADAIVLMKAIKNFLTISSSCVYKDSVVKKPHKKYSWMGA